MLWLVALCVMWLQFDASLEAFPHTFCWLCCSEIDEGGLAQEQFIQSAWKSSAGILVRFYEANITSDLRLIVQHMLVVIVASVVQPWELDSSISPENRQVIERMLLEEHYPF